MTGLVNGAGFPNLEMAKVGGGTLKLPQDCRGSFAVLLAYRGSWCSRCNAQLSRYQELLPAFHDAGIEVYAFSADDEDHATEMVDKHGLRFPVGYGINIEEVSGILKCYVNQERHSLESSNFLLRPDGTIELSVYASSSIGRLIPEEVIEVVNRRRNR